MMKKMIALAALALAASGASAQSASAGFHPLLGAGLTFGGDKLATVEFTDGSTDSIRAGGLVQLFAGGEFRFDYGLTLQGTVGYHVSDSRSARNGSVRFENYPIELIALYAPMDKFRFGAGVQFATGARLTGSGVADDIGAKFKSATGAVIEGEYLFTPKIGLQLRYVNLKFTPKDGSEKVDGSHGGLMFSYYF
jgi:hypothetical protein